MNENKDLQEFLRLSKSELTWLVRNYKKLRLDRVNPIPDRQSIFVSNSRGLATECGLRNLGYTGIFRKKTPTAIRNLAEEALKLKK